MLVWKAIPSMTPMMSAILRLLCWMSSMVDTTSPTTLPPRRATSLAPPASWLAWPAVAALCWTVLVNSSMAAAVCCRLLEVDSVRADRSWLPVAICALATAMLSVVWRTSCTMRASESRMPASERSSSPNSSPRCTSTACSRRSPSATRAASALASASGRWMLRIRKYAPRTMAASIMAAAAAASFTVSMRVAAISAWRAWAVCSCMRTNSCSVPR